MTDTVVVFSLLGTDALFSKIDKATKFAGDFSAPLDILAARMLQFHISRYDSQQTPDGGNWKQSRRSFFEKRPTLVDTGRLRRSMVVFGKTKDSVKVGIPSSDQRNTRIGRVHNTTGDGKRKIIRRFIGFNNSELDELNGILKNRLDNIFK